MANRDEKKRFLLACTVLFVAATVAMSGAQTDQHMDQLLSQLDSSDDSVILKALQELQEIGPKANVALPKIIEIILEHEYNLVRASGCAVIVKIAPKDERTVATIVRALEDEDFVVRNTAKKALEYLQRIMGSEATEVPLKLTRARYGENDANQPRKLIVSDIDDVKTILVEYGIVYGPFSNTLKNAKRDGVIIEKEETRQTVRWEEVSSITVNNSNKQATITLLSGQKIENQPLRNGTLVGETADSNQFALPLSKVKKVMILSSKPKAVYDLINYTSMVINSEGITSFSSESRHEIESLDLTKVEDSTILKTYRKKLLEMSDKGQLNEMKYRLELIQSLYKVLVSYGINKIQCVKDGYPEIGDYISGFLGLQRVIVSVGAHAGKNEENLKLEYKLFVEYLFALDKLSSSIETNIAVRCAVLDMVDKRIEVADPNEKSFLTNLLLLATIENNRSFPKSMTALTTLGHDWKLDPEIFRQNGYIYEAKVMEKAIEIFY